MKLIYSVPDICQSESILLQPMNSTATCWSQRTGQTNGTAGSAQLSGGVMAKLLRDDTAAEDQQGLSVPTPEDHVFMPSRAVMPLWTGCTAEWPSGAQQRPEFSILTEQGSCCLMIPAVRWWHPPILYLYAFSPSPFFHVDRFAWCPLHTQDLSSPNSLLCVPVAPSHLDLPARGRRSGSRSLKGFI